MAGRPTPVCVLYYRSRSPWLTCARCGRICCGQTSLRGWKTHVRNRRQDVCWTICNEVIL